ncbi:hypothetical protein SPRG_02622 [Saprolegnia parasitica CBS 223.65]|uniref:Uncharacterized protein n=1 Tax=Saprolegnia parasitica (strain CBS 223.65) TaxID=695850 RepID=A0A067CQE6_SAPPC|nr:hypothetical protein SPRG_02622 [Saprolegnia parasitica CBS 223.65]KDO32929.1 hypothetical protein SPRG_02622 [Saprolegnia parasitica CBS 223.65]|eukprot:XP_012196576.1 hypothetical protein SPRG_02622 [Saprolegnia parasitica CBS 223.65]
MAPSPNAGQDRRDVVAPLTVDVSPAQEAAPKPRRRRRHHHHHGSLKLLFYLLSTIVVASALILFSALQRMTLESTLYSLMNTMLTAEYYAPTDDGGLIDMTMAPAREVATIDVERIILATLYTQLLNKHSKVLMEIVKGAHVIVENDHGTYYELFRNITATTYTRISSHASIVSQYAVPQGPLLETLLTGVTAEKHSWFQFEGANWDPIDRPIDSILHVLNYLEYKVRGVQIGPLGTSLHTDRNPLRIRFEDTYHYHRLVTPGAAPLPHH